MKNLNTTITIVTGLLLTLWTAEVKGLKVFSTEDILILEWLYNQIWLYVQNFGYAATDDYLLIILKILKCILKISYIFVYTNPELALLIILAINFSYILGKDFYVKHFKWEKKESIFLRFYVLWLNKEKLILTFFFILLIHFPFKYTIQVLVHSTFSVDNFSTHCLVILLGWHCTSYFLSIIIEKIKDNKFWKDIDYSIYNKFVVKSTNLYTFSIIMTNYYLSLNYSLYYYSIICIIIIFIIIIILYLYEPYTQPKDTIVLQATLSDIWAPLIGLGIFSYIIESMNIENLGKGDTISNHHALNRLPFYSGLEVNTARDGSSTSNFNLDFHTRRHGQYNAMKIIEENNLVNNKMWFVINQIQTDIKHLEIRLDNIRPRSFFFSEEYTGLTFWAQDQKALHLVVLPKDKDGLINWSLRSSLYLAKKGGLDDTGIKETLANFSNHGISINLSEAATRNIERIVTHTPMQEVGPKNSGLSQVFKPGGLNTKSFEEILASDHLKMIHNPTNKYMSEINDSIKKLGSQWESNQEVSNEDKKLEGSLWKKFYLNQIKDASKSMNEKGLYSEIKSPLNADTLSHQVFFHGKDTGSESFNGRSIPKTLIKSAYIYKNPNSLKDNLDSLNEKRILDMQDSRKKLLANITDSNGNMFYSHCICINGINIELYKLDKRSWRELPITHSYLKSNDHKEITIRHPNKTVIWKRPYDNLIILNEKDQKVLNAYINYVANKPDDFLKENS